MPKNIYSFNLEYNSYQSITVPATRFGVFNKDINASTHVYEGLNHLQHRGQDSAGICVKMFVLKIYHFLYS